MNLQKASWIFNLLLVYACWGLQILGPVCGESRLLIHKLFLVKLMLGTIKLLRPSSLLIKTDTGVSSDCDSGSFHARFEDLHQDAIGFIDPIVKSLRKSKAILRSNLCFIARNWTTNTQFCNQIIFTVNGIYSWKLAIFWHKFPQETIGPIYL